MMMMLFLQQRRSLEFGRNFFCPSFKGPNAKRMIGVPTLRTLTICMHTCIDAWAVMSPCSRCVVDQSVPRLKMFVMCDVALGGDWALMLVVGHLYEAYTSFFLELSWPRSHAFLSRAQVQPKFSSSSAQVQKFHDALTLRMQTIPLDS